MARGGLRASPWRFAAQIVNGGGMPVLVDHEQQRRKVIFAAASLIASGGVEAATVRAIAKIAGYSTTIVSHYFTDKRALLLLTWRYTADRAARIRSDYAGDASRHVRDFCVALLPTTADLQTIWRTWFAFWNIALNDAEFAAEQHVQVLAARRAITDVFARDPGFSSRSPEWRDTEAAEMLTLIMGVALQAILNPDDWPEERQVRSIDARLVSLGEPPSCDTAPLRGRRRTSSRAG
jgi:AcrR family transcriptional regulator